MSGPKLSEAELERQRQTQLERERLEALRRLKEAQQAYVAVCQKLEDLKTYIKNVSQDIDTVYYADARKELEHILSLVKVPIINNKKNIQEYEQAIVWIKAKIEEAERKVENCLKQYRVRMDTGKQLGKTSMIQQSFSCSFSKESSPITVKNLDFRSDYDSQQLKKEMTYLMQHYQWLAVNSTHDREKKFARESAEKICQILQKNVDLFHVSAIQSKMQAIINEEFDIQRRREEQESLYADYMAAAALMDTEPLPLTAFQDTETLKKQISHLMTQYKKKDEMDYIADKINETMVSLGYGFVTSHVLLRKDRSEMDFSLYQADDATGIAIYTDQSGAVMMRMTVLGEDEDITEEDKDFSFQRQIDFCAAHPDIVNALAERGVFLKQKSYLEPDKKYTYKINTNHSQSVSKSDTAKQTDGKKDKVDRRSRRRAGRKKVRTM